MKTIFVNERDAVRNWYVIDAAGKTLGRVAAKVASVLRGKH
ncbi:MAG: uL13 family ribosomal protein, partial [Spirochaetaceae bacterium]|nr:uL13 family ribosomal protein [Spirochaetaceae bacterium]